MFLPIVFDHDRFIVYLKDKTKSIFHNIYMTPCSQNGRIPQHQIQALFGCQACHQGQMG